MTLNTIACASIIIMPVYKKPSKVELLYFDKMLSITSNVRNITEIIMVRFIKEILVDRIITLSSKYGYLERKIMRFVA